MDGYNQNFTSSFAFNRTNDAELRIVMVGKTGIGKSATGNTILGRKCFESKFSAKSMTVDCSKGKAVVQGQQVAVIDTPGLFDTRFGEDKTTKDLTQCISYCAPGPHVFLVVIRLGRYTDEEKQTVQKIQHIFGQAADRYSMVLFTGGDLLLEDEKTMEEFMEECPELQELVARCNGQYHVFNNKLKKEAQITAQVTELLQKIRGLVQRNGGSHYTNQMFQEAERVIQEEQQRILREKEEEIRREQEKMERKIQEKYEKQMKEINAQIQAEREREREERERERKERAEERKREKEEMHEQRKQEREMREEERKREREERERELTKIKNDLQEQRDREVKQKQDKIHSRYEVEARDEAEDFNPLYPLVKAGEAVVNVGKAAVKGIKNVGRAIGKLFSW